MINDQLCNIKAGHPMSEFTPPSIAIPSGPWTDSEKNLQLLPKVYTRWNADDYIRYSEKDTNSLNASGTVSHIPHGNNFIAQVLNGHINERIYTKGITHGWVAFQFALEGEHSSMVRGYGQFNYSGPRLTINSASQPTRIVSCYLEESKFSQVNICVRPQFLVEQFGVSPERLPPTIQSMLKGAKDGYFNRSLPLTPSMMRAADELTKFNYSGKMQETFAKVKTMELLCLAIEAMTTINYTPTTKATLGDRDIDLLHQARDILGRDYSTPPTLAELARRIGLNRNKLSQGFKALFGSGVYEYCQQLRMQKAKRLLQENRFSLQQVAENIGFQNQSSFTRAYKNFYGNTPSFEKKE